ncbi:MAG TPA: peptidoglycan DD-metalloendopeptidase family protein [Nitrospiraceae bacterium]
MIDQPRKVEEGDHGSDVRAYKRALYQSEGVPHTLDWPVKTNIFGKKTEAAVRKFQDKHKLKITGKINKETYAHLYRHTDTFGKLLIANYARKHKTRAYPLGRKGVIIGRPYQGTHNHPNPSDSMHNWESCNAVDLGIPFGTKVIAVRAGLIGDRIGPLDSSNPVLLGERLHLITDTNDYYYAHLSKILVRAGQRVVAGELLGLSGEANTVNHLHFAQEVGDPGVTIGSPTSGYVDQHYPG